MSSPTDGDNFCDSTNPSAQPYCNIHPSPSTSYPPPPPSRRLLLCNKVPFGNDGDFSDTAFQNRVNSNLANEVGNLAMRTLSMAVKNCGGQVPRPATSAGDTDGGEEGSEKKPETGEFELTEEDRELLKAAGECLAVVRPLIGETQQLHKALEAILNVRGGGG